MRNECDELTREWRPAKVAKINVISVLQITKDIHTLVRPFSLTNLDDSKMGSKYSVHNSAEETSNADASTPMLTTALKDIVIEGFENAKENTTKRIIQRMCQQRDDFKDFMNVLGSDLSELFATHLKNYIHGVIQNIASLQKVRQLSEEFGRIHAALRVLGFKPDFFAVMANSIATECAFLSDTTTSAATTFKAWTNLVSIMFTYVREGYYSKLRSQRRTPSNDELGLNISKSESELQILDEKWNPLDSRSSTPNTSATKNSNKCKHEFGSMETISARGTSKLTDKAIHEITSSKLNLPLHRKKAFYIQDRMIQQQQKSTYTLEHDNSTKSSNLNQLDMQNIRNEAMIQHKATITSTTHTNTANNAAGHYRKNVTQSDDQRRRYRKSMYEKSASTSNLFDPNRIIDDFMHDRL